ncbi:syntaxin-5 [Nilaparvata lugens]|uniref:syntaxin-5 n=1 Tax=Nilaparvata lugens TaxID=108931 RepID=UPI000B97E570|nr:syntaxin-5 [Nilaparvata lugens]
MTARRRRVGSESEQVPLVGGSGGPDSIQDGGDSSHLGWNAVANHSGASGTGAYNGPEHTDWNNAARLGARPKVRDSDHSLAMTSPAASARDRTAEFANAIRSLQGRQLPRAVRAPTPNKARYIQSYAEFMMIAKTIGKNLSGTFAKLEKLMLLAKRKTMFNDRPTEIQELTYIIKEDLNSLNGQIARLQEVSRRQRQLQSAATKQQHLLSHSSSVVLALQSKLAAMSTEFKNVLQVRTENLKQAKSRRDQFSLGTVSSALPPSAVSGPYHQGSVLLADEHQQQQVSIDLEPRAGMLMQAQAQALILDETDQYLSSRAETMQNIESTIVELGGIFSQLAFMVKEQEEMVERIDANVQDAEMNVESAHNEILKYFQSVSSNRWLMIKIFAVLIFFFIFFVIFLA